MQALEIEIDGPRNEALLFAPLQRSIRGRCDLMRLGAPECILEAQKWPGPIPSQKLGIDPDGNGYLEEPLHAPEFSPHRERIEKKMGMKLEPAVQEFPGIHLPSWLFWIKRAVESGIAKVTKGKLPDVIDGKPRLNYVLAEPEATNTDKLTAALQQQTAAFNRLSDVIVKLLDKK